jgi:hypothetical protein
VFTTFTFTKLTVRSFLSCCVLSALININLLIVVYGSLKSVLYSLVTERDRLKIYVQEGESTLGTTVGGSGAVVATLRATLHHALQQNSELRSRLKAIHAQSDPTDLPHLVSYILTVLRTV